jgi:FKBP-type peptidyl-prolyl cis-trans isomerase 2
MKQAQKGDNVQVHYTGKLNDGSVFDSSQGREPLAFTVGAGQMIPGFDRAVVGMTIGDKQTITIPSVEAYGERREDLVVSIPAENIPEDMNPQVGDRFAINQPDGQQIPVVVTALDAEKITLDANHDLAGKDLIFDIEMVEIS